jgi:hypothetical protein
MYLLSFCVRDNLNKLSLNLCLLFSLLKFSYLELSVDYLFFNSDNFFKKLWTTHFLE